MKNRASILTKLTSLSKLEVILIIVFLLLFIFASGFAINHFMWHRYIDKAFSPFLANEKIEFDYESDGWTHYNYSDYENGYFIQIGVPPYLKYGGTIMLSMQFKEPEPGSFRGNLMLFHSSIRIHQKLVLNLGEQTGAGSHYTLGSAIDRYGKPLGRNPRDSEQFYSQWLTLYDKHYTDAMTILTYFKNFFGEDLLQ
ncbi:MAG: hypothetical protein FWD38_10340 [Oscillospiraceae bacterium]|nr:hypothetical protein [Oscillospiraceae bacterium]